jgi:hypothetical protein
MHVELSGQATAVRAFAVPLERLTQFCPPFGVWKMVPAAPTATHVPADAQEMPFIVCVVPPPACTAQEPPPFVVASVIPCLPAA